MTALHATNHFDLPHETDIAWCPGCGNFPILHTIKKTLVALNVDQQKTVFVSGIGQAGKFPQYLKCHYFNGLHGRALPPAIGIKASNPELTVIVESGDGDVYGEGGNHFIHAIRANPDITVIVHDNMIYGLTKGQASPTSEVGLKTPLQPDGVFVDPLNPIALAIALDAPFVARASAANPDHLKKIVMQAVQHKGFSLVDVFQPCVVFNKVNTYEWFKNHTYMLEETYDPTDRVSAFAKALESDRMPLGVIYRNDRRVTFEEEIGVYAHDRTPLWRRDAAWEKVEAIIRAKQ
ncbi:2-oxoacid ferredoxin oxidoreductase [Candidatus Kaiserbacteria bacterium RIFCSPHIGHO2_01_FULL_54_36b]|uniref:2-oxoacid ferredoxin oxidoreductase n=1 Tax=Candidatus Kaiserbacteria bacterium RIFCSPHIGHO2_01_FULL_54_36b TaxID=1798483 RepID=A0A1F6CLM8_9BACT|nr:MAG: 2-oxoacid ferredoxin oxidoreductase [Candidatus Kaiserbacteria bacterium RIFCSPHIGHO2_01_FULL_54_36b]